MKLNSSFDFFQPLKNFKILVLTLIFSFWTGSSYCVQTIITMLW